MKATDKKLPPSRRRTAIFVRLNPEIFKLACTARKARGQTWVTYLERAIQTHEEKDALQKRSPAA